MSFASDGKLTGRAGTQGYQAPELLSNRPYEGPPVDVYSLGIILFCMVTHYMPFKKPGDSWFKSLMNDEKKFYTHNGL